VEGLRSVENLGRKLKLKYYITSVHAKVCRCTRKLVSATSDCGQGLEISEILPKFSREISGISLD
jgi:hypothetical protein